MKGEEKENGECGCGWNHTVHKGLGQQLPLLGWIRIGRHGRNHEASTGGSGVENCDGGVRLVGEVRTVGLTIAGAAATADRGACGSGRQHHRGSKGGNLGMAGTREKTVDE